MGLFPLTFPPLAVPIANLIIQRDLYQSVPQALWLQKVVPSMRVIMNATVQNVKPLLSAQVLYLFLALL